MKQPVMSMMIMVESLSFNFSDSSGMAIYWVVMPRMPMKIVYVVYSMMPQSSFRLGGNSMEFISPQIFPNFGQKMQRCHLKKYMSTVHS